jgi:tripartite-type tricarboxylate transporter receptor subunit TctC
MTAKTCGMTMCATMCATAVLLGIGVLASSAAHAQNYPARPVRMVVPFAPGAASDITGRLVAQKLAEGFGQSFVVDNRPGAGGNIGHELVARAPADGYTLVLANESLAINAALPRPLPFDTLRGFAAVSTVSMNPRVFVVIASSPYASIRDLLAAARSKPGSIRYGSSGIGTGPHLAGALLSTMAKVELTHVPYKGAAPALADVVGGQIETIASTILSAQPLIQSGRARALAVTSTRRSEALPGVPTVAETIPGFEASSWSMVLGPAGVPRPILLRLHEEIARFLQQPEVRKRIAGDGGEPVGSSPDQAAAQLKSDVERWRRVIREAGVGAEG